MFTQPFSHLVGDILPLGILDVKETVLADLFDHSQIISREIVPTELVGNDFALDSIHLNGEVCRIRQQFHFGLEQISHNNDTFPLRIDWKPDGFKELDKKPEVILFIYDCSELRSFQELEIWIQRSGELVDEHTEFILLGIQKDPAVQRVVDEDLIINGVIFIEQKISSQIPAWSGTCSHFEITNPSQFNLVVLKNLITRSILRSKGILCMEGLAIPLETTRLLRMNDLAALP